MADPECCPSLPTAAAFQASDAIRPPKGFDRNLCELLLVNGRIAIGLLLRSHCAREQPGVAGHKRQLGWI